MNIIKINGYYPLEDGLYEETYIVPKDKWNKLSEEAEEKIKSIRCGWNNDGMIDIQFIKEGDPQIALPIKNSGNELYYVLEEVFDDEGIDFEEAINEADDYAKSLNPRYTREIRENKEWILTDDDSFQIQRKILGKYYEMYQIQQIATFNGNPKYGISHAVIDVSDIDEDMVIDCFAYDSIEEMKNTYKGHFEEVLAECDFEIHAMEYLMGTPYMDWEEARDMIAKISGYR